MALASCSELTVLVSPLEVWTTNWVILPILSLLQLHIASTPFLGR